MLIEWIFDLLIEVPFLLIDTALYQTSCLKCGGRLKYMQRTRDKVQCVMCDRVWLKGKRGRVLPVDSNG
jgi:PHP family Zn ribbon phosphoesterase